MGTSTSSFVGAFQKTLNTLQEIAYQNYSYHAYLRVSFHKKAEKVTWFLKARVNEVFFFCVAYLAWKWRATWKKYFISCRYFRKAQYAEYVFLLFNDHGSRYQGRRNGSILVTLFFFGLQILFLLKRKNAFFVKLRKTVYNLISHEKKTALFHLFLALNLRTPLKLQTYIMLLIRPDINARVFLVFNSHYCPLICCLIGLLTTTTVQLDAAL